MLSWFQQLDRAATIDEVVGISRDYFATWTPEEIARLPISCRPGRIRTPSDIDDLHECAVDAFRTSRVSGDELKALQLLTNYLVRASLRLAHIRASGPDEGLPGDAASTTIPPKRHSKPRDL